MIGWIKLDRAIRQNFVWDEPEALKLWLELIMTANIKPVKKLFNGKLISVKRGQLVFGRLAFSQRLGISESRIRRYIKMFESEQMISQQKTNKYTIITVTCYSKYQDSTNKSPSNDHQSVHTRRRSKEVKNIFIAPSVDEVKKYCEGRGNTINPESFVAYYDARGWEFKKGQKVKDWKACVRTWEGKAKTSSEARTEVIL